MNHIILLHQFSNELYINQNYIIILLAFGLMINTIGIIDLLTKKEDIKKTQNIEHQLLK